jgi:hyperosmotically inducible protein
MFGIRNACFALALAFAAFALPASAERTAGENIDDATVATRVKAVLIESDQVSANHINVEVYQGVVQLGGFVESETERAAALAATRRIGAAKEVIDAMVILPGHRTLGQTVDDAGIQVSLNAELAKVEGVDAVHKIITQVRQGHVLLSGFLGHADQIARAGQIANGISGVKEVHNKIALKP